MSSSWDEPFAVLRAKWHEVPASLFGRISSSDLRNWSDSQLLDYWNAARNETTDGPHGYRIRGWLYAVYRNWARGRKILEVGSGLGFDAVSFTEFGAEVTVVDIVQSNLDVVSRIFALKGLPPPPTICLDSVERIDQLGTDFDAVFGFGSLHHTPSAVIKPELDALVRRLKPGGRFLFHAYPKQRWIDEGRMPFEHWGEKTDGPGTPWAEWYDTQKLLAVLRPARFLRVFDTIYEDGAMIGIDLVKTEGDPDLSPESLPPNARMLRKMEPQNLVASVQSSNGARLDISGTEAHLTTPDACWSYALVVPLKDLPKGRITVRLRLFMEAGRIGAGVVPSIDEDFLTERYVDQEFEPEYGLDPAAFIEDLALTFTAASSSALLIIRNACQSHVASRMVLHAIEIWGSDLADG